MGAVAKSYLYGKGLLIYEEIRKYLVIYEEAVSHIGMTLQPLPLLDFLIYEKKFSCLFYECSCVGVASPEV